MKKKIIKIVFIGLLLLIGCVLLFSIILPLFRKKASDKDIQRVSFAENKNMQDYQDNVSHERIICVDDNLEALLWRLKVINSAKDKIDFVTFSFNDDRSGRDIMSALYNASQRGVKVRMVVDGLSTFLYLKNSDYFNVLAGSENIKIKVYNPIRLLKPWRINYRMHDKYIISDNNIYMLGGRNTKNLSIGNYQEKKDIDRDVVVFNASPSSDSSLNQVESYFESIWNASCTEDYRGKKIRKSQGNKHKNNISNLQAYYANLQEDFPLAFGSINWMSESMAVNKIQLLSNPINNGNKVPVLWASLHNLLKNGKDIIIQTPYIMCDRMMYDDLTELNNNGRCVSIVTNSVENGANICGCADYLNQKRKIMKIGSKIYECNGEHSSHAKTVLMDDNISVIGSFNYDMRSAYIDTELMLVIDSPQLNKYLRNINTINIDQSRCVHPDGTITYGSNYHDKKMALSKKVLYGFLRVATVPIRHLL